MPSRSAEEVIAGTVHTVLNNQFFHLDWLSRKQWLQELQRARPRLYACVLESLAADQALEGLAGPCAAPTIISLRWPISQEKGVQPACKRRRRK
eukprot:9838432-Lingulodinium_polyedra.AAC.1